MHSPLLSRQLESFLACARHGSFAQAAAAQYISVSALIEQIERLEFKLKLKLFVRSPRGLTLTPAGRQLQTAAVELTAFADKTLRELMAAQLREKTVHFGSSPIVSGTLGLELFNAVHYQIPEVFAAIVPFNNVEREARDILTHLGDSIDIVPGLYDERFLAACGCTALPVRMTQFGLSVPQDLPLAQRPYLSLADLKDFKIAIQPSGTLEVTDNVRAALSQVGLGANIVETGFMSIDAFNRAYHDKTLVLNIREWAGAHPFFRFVPLKPVFTGTFGLIHAVKPRPCVQRFLQAVAAYLKNSKL